MTITKEDRDAIKTALVKLMHENLGLESEIKRLNRAIQLTQMPLTEENERKILHRRIAQFVFQQANFIASLLNYNLKPELSPEIQGKIESFRSVLIPIEGDEKEKRTILIDLLSEIKKEKYEAEKEKFKNTGVSYLFTFYEYMDMLWKAIYQFADKLTGDSFEAIKKERDDLELESGMFIAGNSSELFAHLLVTPNVSKAIEDQLGDGYIKIKEAKKDHKGVVDEVSSVLTPSIIYNKKSGPTENSTEKSPGYKL